MKSDSDSHGSSESDNQRESVVPAGRKHGAPSSLSDSAVEDESSDRDDVTRKVQSLSLTSPGTVNTRMKKISTLLFINVNLGKVRCYLRIF